MKILIVDDSRSSRRILKQNLRDMNFEVQEADSGIAALSILKNERFDLITLDVEMPYMNGFETCAEIRRREDQLQKDQTFNPTPIVFITGNDDLEGRKKGFESGATDFIRKSEIIEHFQTVVDGLLRSDKRLQDLKALIIDHSIYSRQAVSVALCTQGVRVHESSMVSDVLPILEKDPKSFDLIICDLANSEMSEIDFCKKIRLDFGNKIVPIIVLSSELNREVSFELFKAGITDFMTKPFLSEELLARCLLHLEATMLMRRLRKSLDETARIQQVQEKFLAVCSHDIRSPLAGIVGLIDFVKEEPDAGERGNLLETMKTAGLVAMEMVTNILELCRSEIMKDDAFNRAQNLSDIIRDIVEQQAGFARTKNIGIKVQITQEEREPMVLGNRVALLTILNNLVSNALKFTPLNKEITIRVKSRGPAHLLLEVSDQGIGIPEAELANFFNQINKQSRLGTRGERGSGLGLIVVKEFVERHSGSIEVESKLGLGSCFRIVLPRLESFEAQAPRPLPQTA